MTAAGCHTVQKIAKARMEASPTLRIIIETTDNIIPDEAASSALRDWLAIRANTAAVTNEFAIPARIPVS